MRSAAFVVLSGLLAVAGCAAPPRPSPYLSPAELTDLVSGQTLHVQAEDDASFGTLAYFDPAGGGWFDAHAVEGTPPAPGEIAMILRWRVTDRSGVCAWTTPLVGEIPFWVPPHYDCIQVLRSDRRPGGLDGVVARGGGTVRTPLRPVPGNGFPPEQTALFAEQVRVLSGGRIPAWQIPAIPPDLRSGSADAGL